MRRLEYKWIVAIVLVIGLFMDVLDTTIVNVALPTFAADFNAPTTTIEWVVSGYLLSLAVFIPISGWAGDRFGTKRTFIFALTVFTACSGLCALSWSIESLIVFRVLQGVGGGMLTPVATAMMWRVFPPAERARASAITSIPIIMAPAAGPILGGYLVEYYSWHWIFLINIPVGILGLIVSSTLLREEKQAGTGSLDVPGFVLSGAGFATLVYALSEAGSQGFGDSRVLLFGGIGIVLIAAFVVSELRTPKPMIDIRLFRNRLFTAGNFVQMCGSAGFVGALFLLPIFLQSEKGFSPLESGLTTFPGAIGFVLMAQLAVRLYPRIGPRRSIMMGSAGFALSSLAFVKVGLVTGAWWIRGIILFRGLSSAFLFIPLQTATFATVSRAETGRASAVYNITRQVSSSLGVALLASVLTNRLSAHSAVLGDAATSGGAIDAFHDAFFVSAILAALGGVVALLISDKEAAATMAPARTPEAGEAESEAVAAH